ncbi:MAG TPA: glucose 1-dehydrogenase [Saprospiraceae bacterium]|nr:glucose 1-dehydrogenase [Saprospiraceae bacterium]HMP25190.1 glucose 1-dehydrogenase [Saprospiraceae bacterium]
MQFENQTVIITGGSSGIGLAAAQAFAHAGARVVNMDIAPPKIALVEANILYYQTDVADKIALEKQVEKVLQQFGSLDVLVNSAGVSGEPTGTDQLLEADFDRVMGVNVKGTLFAMQAVLPHFKERRRGSIVNVASMAGHVVMPGYLAYVASKHAVLGITKVTALEFAKYNIRVNAVCPAFTSTPMISDMEANTPFRDALLQAFPMKRFATAEEIAAGILFLASDAASFMTGTGMIMDGGLSLQ